MPSTTAQPASGAAPRQPLVLGDLKPCFLEVDLALLEFDLDAANRHAQGLPLGPEFPRSCLRVK